jgi:hypothetical protein
MDMLQSLALFIVAFIGSAVGGGVVSYTKKKGENRALREDIEELTRAVESIKTLQSLRMLAGAERLKAHQEAFCLWRRLLEAVHGPELEAILDESNAWWNGNCLYLDQPARHTFIQGLASLRGWLMLRAVEDSGPSYDEALNREWHRFYEDMPKALFEGAGLPPLAEIEVTSVKKI